MSKLSPATARDHTHSAGDHGRAVVVVSLLALVVVSACLRPPITAFGPVVGRIGAETGLGSGALGLLGALPIIGFAVVSPFVFLVARRLGEGRTILAALLVLLAGIGVRFVPDVTALWIGTAVIGVAIAVGNVLLPSLVKRDFPHRIPLVTGIYSASLGGCAAIGSGLSVPIADATGSWRMSIGSPIVVVVIAIGVWLVWMRTRRDRPGRGSPTGGVLREGGAPVWSSSTAWYVTAYMGFQSTGFYITVTWLPSIEVGNGYGETIAGWHLFLCQIAGLAAGVGTSLFLGRLRDQRVVAALTCVPVIVGCIGLATAPALAILWVVLIGVSQGGALTIALALIGMRTGSTLDTARLSGMAQGVGYALAAIGPVVAGLLHEATGAWQPVLWLLVAIAVAQLVCGFGAGRDVVIGRRDATAPVPVPTGGTS